MILRKPACSKANVNHPLHASFIPKANLRVSARLEKASEAPVMRRSDFREN